MTSLPTQAPGRFSHFALRGLYLIWLNVRVSRPIVDRVMTAFFGRLASSWDARTSDIDRLAPLTEALTRINTESINRVLDMGCGTGGATIALERALPSAWVAGIDASDQMIDLALEKAREHGSAVVFERERIQRTGLDAGSFDLITLVNAPPAFDEVHRLLRRGGFAIVVFTLGPGTPFYSSPRRLERGFRRHGMLTTATGTAGQGEFFIATNR